MSTFDCRVSFAETLIELAEADERIVAVCNDSVGSSNLGGFRERFPDRLINVGIAEQNMVGVAAGLANAGLIPFVSAASPFLTGRALEQIKADIVYSHANVKLCGQSPGVSYGELGPTHHSIEDIAWMRALDDLPIVVPADPEQTAEAVRWAAALDGPVFLRIGRYKVPSVSQGRTPAFRAGQAELLRSGADVTLVANGTMVAVALDAAGQLAEAGIEARVLNLATVHPIDRDALIDAARTTRGIVTIEESVPRGGLGGAVAELLAQTHPARMRMLGTHEFAVTGDVDYLFERFDLTASGVVAAARDVVGQG
jgi:transketolase